MRRLFPIVLMALATPAFAAASEAPKTAPGQYVDLSPVALPIVGKGELVNYAFVYVRLNLAPQVDPVRLRALEPYFRDALVRLGHRTPLNPPDNYMKIDEARLRAALLREATAIAGPGQVSSVTVTSQAPRRRVAGPVRGG